MIYLTQRLDHAHPITASVTLPIDVRVKKPRPCGAERRPRRGLIIYRAVLRGGIPC